MSHGPTSFNLPAVIISIMGTAIFWGVYGPLLQKGHMLMGSGRLRPFICVGVAYILVAIIGPIVVMMMTGMEKEGGLASGWTTSGVIWSLIAGMAGALGALGMILAFNFGGKPSYVPPLIFGLAPVVNTFFAMYLNPALWTKMTPVQSSFFGAGLILVAVGAVTVLVAAPKAGPPAGKEPPASERDTDVSLPVKSNPFESNKPPV
ncbi:MAG TPA: hypothetical protein VMP01_10200 [Pirellulaceae bacterium]|nr:hypothetical protein [Pirellulaceae bacterium]